MRRTSAVSRRLIERLRDTLREERELRERISKVGRRAGRLLRHISYRGVPHVVVARGVAPVLEYAETIDGLLSVCDALRARLRRHRRLVAAVSPSEPGTRPSRSARRRGGATPGT